MHFSLVTIKGPRTHLIRLIVFSGRCVRIMQVRKRCRGHAARVGLPFFVKLCKGLPTKPAPNVAHQCSSVYVLNQSLFWRRPLWKRLARNPCSRACKQCSDTDGDRYRSCKSQCGANMLASLMNFAKARQSCKSPPNHANSPNDCRLLNMCCRLKGCLSIKTVFDTWFYIKQFMV